MIGCCLWWTFASAYTCLAPKLSRGLRKPALGLQTMLHSSNMFDSGCKPDSLARDCVNRNAAIFVTSSHAFMMVLHQSDDLVSELLKSFDTAERH